VVKSIRLCSELFSLENGLFTPTFKLKRFEAKKKFEKEIQQMYAELATGAN
jgi:long-chain acyl-CoA synthetase